MASPSTSLSLQPVTQDASSSSKPAPLFDLRFSLTEAEWREAAALLHPISGGAYAKPWLRLFCGFCAVVNLMAPALNGTSWSELIQYAPGRAAFAAIGALACASGAIWMKSLDHRLNRVDLERHIIMTDTSVTVTWNNRTWNHRWQDFAYFREGQNVVILRNPGVRYWTIPLRAVPADSQLHFRKLLCSKLARRQPYSWSPDSSGVPRLER